MAAVTAGARRGRRPTHTNFAMRGNRLVAAATLVVGALLSGCSSPSPGDAVGYEHFRFTCCVNSGLQQAWHPVQGMTLHWIVESVGMTSDAAGHPITLTAILMGPYASVAILKAGGPHARTLAASQIPVTDRTPGSPVSSIALPLDLAAGWYNLAFTVKSSGGNLVGSATVIQVTRPSAPA
jgi:hypothetical protein